MCPPLTPVDSYSVTYHFMLTFWQLECRDLSEISVKKDLEVIKRKVMQRNGTGMMRRR